MDEFRKKAVELVLLAREEQHEKWGVQSFPDGTGAQSDTPLSDQLNLASARLDCDTSFAEGKATFAKVFSEEVWEAKTAEPGSDNLVEEVSQVAAVCVQWLEKILREREMSRVNGY